jgi:plastocyanin
MSRITKALVVLLLCAACTESADPSAPEANLGRVESAMGFPSEVTISFGKDAVGTTYFPPGEHDASFHAKDKIRPHLTNLAAGGNVIFEIGSFHGVAIYEPGTRPEDIEISESTLEDLVLPFPPFLLEDFLINDPDGRATDRAPVTLAPTQWSPPEGTFDEPGVYLVICYVLPHFAGANMYAYINVRPTS